MGSASWFPHTPASLCRVSGCPWAGLWACFPESPWNWSMCVSFVVYRVKKDAPLFARQSEKEDSATQGRMETHEGSV